uniref:Uncharacterized protein n=1 Tax=Cacopsylla melanoneura TaxID=428564 RepID=A0A8D8RJR7_9HEMI
MSRTNFDANEGSKHHLKIPMYPKRNRKHKAKHGLDNNTDNVSDEAEQDVPKWKQAFRSLKNSLKAHLYDIRNQKHYNRHDYKHIKLQEKSGKDSREIGKCGMKMRKLIHLKVN